MDKDDIRAMWNHIILTEVENGEQRYAEENKNKETEMHKFKVGDIIEYNGTIVIIIKLTYENYSCDVIHNTNKDEVNTGYMAYRDKKWKLYEYGVGDIVYVGSILFEGRKRAVVKELKANGIISVELLDGSLFDAVWVTLIKSARWTKEHETKELEFKTGKEIADYLVKEYGFETKPNAVIVFGDLKLSYYSNDTCFWYFKDIMIGQNEFKLFNTPAKVDAFLAGYGIKKLDKGPRVDKQESKPQHNYKVGDKVVITENALESEGITVCQDGSYKSAIGKIGVIHRLYDKGYATILAPLECGGIWDYKFSQFKPYIEPEQKSTFVSFTTHNTNKDEVNTGYIAYRDKDGKRILEKGGMIMGNKPTKKAKFIRFKDIVLKRKFINGVYIEYEGTLVILLHKDTPMRLKKCLYTTQEYENLVAELLKR